MNDTLLFAAKFLRHGRRVASLVPSSRFLARAVIAPHNWDSVHIALELGGGTGAITKEIVKYARPDCRIIVIERDHDFVLILQRKFSSDARIEIIEGDCVAVMRELGNRAIGRVDAVISGLSVPNFSPETQREYFHELRRILADNALYTQITEVPWIFFEFYKKYFEAVRFTFVPLNIPPGGVYTCTGVKA